MVVSSITHTILSLAAAAICIAASIAVQEAQMQFVLGISALIFIGLSMFGMWRINMAINAIQVVTDEYKKGNLEPRLWIPGEGGKLSNMLDSINHTVDVIDAFIREAKAAMQFAMAEKYYRKIQLTGFAGTYRHGAQIFNAGLDGIRENTMRSMRHAAIELDKAAEQGDIQAKHLMESVSTTSANIGSVAAAMEEMSATVSEIAIQIDRASKISSETAVKAKISGEQLGELKESTQQIRSITSVIHDITNKINLLALNATIEAARAGEAGKGFSVVASEVKELANSTAKATNQITHNIERINGKMNAVSEIIEEMLVLIQRMDEATLVISSAMNQQSVAAHEIARSVNNASDSSKAVSETAQQVSEQASRTWQVSRNMQEVYS